MISWVNGFVCLTEAARQRAAAGINPAHPEAGQVTKVTESPGLDATKRKAALPARPDTPVVRALV